MKSTAAGLSRRTVHALLWGPIVVLMVLGILRYVYLGADFPVPVRWIDFGAEGSGVMWWSSLMWGGAAVLCLLEFDRHATWLRYYWLAVAIGSLLLSLDESVQIHEHFAPTLLHGVPAFAAPWVVVAIPVVAVCFLLLIPFLMSLPRRTAGGLILSGAVFVLGAVGMEMIFAYVRTTAPSEVLLVRILITLEESLEMIGIAMFCMTVHGHLNRQERYSPRTRFLPLVGPAS
ncbi:MAG TPA: hypothetical protein VIZ90_00360 [Rhizobiaceae bacterium]